MSIDTEFKGMINSIEKSGELVLRVISRINCVRCNLSHHTDYQYYAKAHFKLITNNCDVLQVAKYYAVLQSFSNDFSMHLTTVAEEAIAGFDPIAQYSKLFKCHNGSGDYDLSEHMFIEHAELNPYLAFARGNLSAHTVINVAVINLVLALNCELIQQPIYTVEDSINSDYVSSVLLALNLK